VGALALHRVGLLPVERRLVRRTFFPALALFAVGVSLRLGGAHAAQRCGVLATYLDPAKFRPIVTVSEYFSFVSLLTLVMRLRVRDAADHVGGRARSAGERGRLEERAPDCDPRGPLLRRRGHAGPRTAVTMLSSPCP
jgi:hypothetical protein